GELAAVARSDQPSERLHLALACDRATDPDLHDQSPTADAHSRQLGRVDRAPRVVDHRHVSPVLWPAIVIAEDLHDEHAQADDYRQQYDRDRQGLAASHRLNLLRPLAYLRHATTAL